MQAVVRIVVTILALGSCARAQQTDMDGRTDHPLLVAAREGSLEKVRVLLRKGANPNRLGRWKDTALHHAKTAAVAKLLIEAGARVNAQNDVDQTPLECARNLEIAKLLVKHGANLNLGGFTPLCQHLLGKHNDIAAWLLSKGAATSGPHNYPLHIASEAGNIEGIRLLLRHGVSVSVRDDLGRTALHQALTAAAVNELVRGGCPVNARTTKSSPHNARFMAGSTALHFACIRGLLDVVKALVAAGADINAKNGLGGTPYGVARQYPKVRDYLRSKGGRSGLEGL